MADFDQVLNRIQNQLDSMKKSLRNRRMEFREKVMDTTSAGSAGSVNLEKKDHSERKNYQAESQ